jgi:hypothetical protein
MQANSSGFWQDKYKAGKHFAFEHIVTDNCPLVNRVAQGKLALPAAHQPRRRERLLRRLVRSPQ